MPSLCQNQSEMVKLATHQSHRSVEGQNGQGFGRNMHFFSLAQTNWKNGCFGQILAHFGRIQTCVTVGWPILPFQIDFGTERALYGGAPYWLLGICQILSKSAVSWCILAILQNDTPDLLYVGNRGILHPQSHSKGAWGHQPAKKAKKCEKGPFWCFTLYWGENEWNSKKFSSQNQVLAWAPWWY